MFMSVLSAYKIKPMEYIIRSCNSNDLQKVVELCTKHAEYEMADYNPIGKEELLKDSIFSNEPKLFCCVVESNNQLIGYFSYTFDFSTWDAFAFLYLDCLYLEPLYRGYGIGGKVMQFIKDIARQKNCVNIQWQTPTFNHRAIKFYNRVGGRGKDKVRFFLDVCE